MNCPACSEKALKVIYMGLPMKLCSDPECSCVWGVCSWVTFLFFNGVFMIYEGSYLPALWHWLTGDVE